MTVNAKGPNDAAFLSHAQKMMRASFGVLAWMVITVVVCELTHQPHASSAPYRPESALGFATVYGELVGDEQNLFSEHFSPGGTSDGARSDGGTSDAKLYFLYITILALFMLLPSLSPCIVVPFCGYIGAKHQDKRVINFVVCQHFLHR